MHSIRELPGGYREILSVDLQRDKKKALLVNVLALFIAVALAMAAAQQHPLVLAADSLGPTLLRLGTLVLGIFAYIILHEAVHGVVMYAYSRVKPHFGFTALYAYAGSDMYFDKGSYLIIALAPVLLWGAVLAILCAVVPADWFWVVYIIQIMNLSGAAGDYYVTVRFFTLPRDIYVHDSGTAMRVYSAQS